MCGGSRQEAKQAVRTCKAPPPAGYVLLAASSGSVLTHSLELRPRGTDAAMWVPEDANGSPLAYGDVHSAVQFRSAAVGGARQRVVSAHPCQTGTGTPAGAGTVAIYLSVDGGQSVLCETTSTRATAEAVGQTPRGNAGAEAVFSAEIGPARLPSEHLDELRESGFTKLRAVSADQIASMKSTLQRRIDSLVSLRRTAGVEISGQGRVQEFNLNEEEEGFHLVENSPLFARLHSHPVMLYLLEAFTGGPVRAAHPPSTRITMPQSGDLGPGGGW